LYQLLAGINGAGPFRNFFEKTEKKLVIFFSPPTANLVGDIFSRDTHALKNDF
jgi:hypothetical protein